MRNGTYLAWVGSLPCLICQRNGMTQTSKTDAHHFGPHAYGRKAPDEMAVPLCHVEHHIFGREAVHVLGRRFAEHHGLDMNHEIARLHSEFGMEKAD